MAALWKTKTDLQVKSRSHGSWRRPQEIFSPPRKNWHVPRAIGQVWLLLVGLLCGDLGAQSEEAVVIGHVLDLSGRWDLYRDAAAGNLVKELRAADVVSPHDVIRIKSPSKSDYISIVDTQLNIIIERRCQPPSTCYQPIFLPEVASRPAPGDELVRKVWTWLAGEPYLWSLHRVRGPGRQFAEGVVPIVDEEINLADVMYNIEKGSYSLASYESQPTHLGRDEFVKFDWDPRRPRAISIGKLGPGLYEIRRAETAAELFGSQRISVRILLCAPQQCPQAVPWFRRVKSSTEKWDGAATPETIHAFLRVCLAELAKTGGPSGN
jgi:hypothetical protein